MINSVKNLTVVTQLSNLTLKSLVRQLGMKMVKYEDKMLILGLNYIFRVPSVVNACILKCLVASHMIERDSLLLNRVLY